MAGGPQLFHRLRARHRNGDDDRRRMLMHRFFSTSDACEMDAQGRIIIPTKFRQYAGLNGEAVVIGVHDHFEIWSPTAWERYNEEMEQEDLTILQLPF